MRGFIRSISQSGVFLLGLFVACPLAKAGPDLYACETAATPGDTENAMLRRCLEEVVVRVTGDASLAGSRRISPILDTAEGFIGGGLRPDAAPPGAPPPATRRFVFEKDKLDPAIEAFGFNIWPAKRPLTAVFMEVIEPKGRAILDATGPGHADLRGKLQSPANQRGVPILLPSGQAAAAIAPGVSASEIDVLAAAAKALGADAVLFGSLRAEGDGYWSAALTLLWIGQDLQTWESVGVTAEAALRDAVERAAKIYSNLSADGVGR
ncbi:MAG: DUF2066 domain-containing protein [Hyphomicrobiales bacterium]|nr:DUF2066 domain-containing protein [Hyphomicrobiales bacterium]